MPHPSWFPSGEMTGNDNSVEVGCGAVGIGVEDRILIWRVHDVKTSCPVEDYVSDRYEQCR